MEANDMTNLQKEEPQAPSMALSCRQKLVDWKFDPDHLTQATSKWYDSSLRNDSNIPYGRRKSVPMVLFAQLGDQKVLQYILQSIPNPQVALHQTDEYDLFPLYVAISEPHSEEQVVALCQWLFQQGANLQQTLDGQWSALGRACLKGYRKVALWLVQSGALLEKPESSGRDQVLPRRFATSLAQRDLPRRGRYPGIFVIDALEKTQSIHKEIFAWAKETVATNEAFLWVLLGTILPPTPDNDDELRDTVARRIARSNTHAAMALLLQGIDRETLGEMHRMTLSPLLVLAGQSDVLRQIGAFAGYTTDRDLLTTARGLVKHEQWWDGPLML